MIKLLEAKNLPSMDTFSESAPYCIFKLANQTARSKVVWNDNNCKWNENLSLNVKSLSDPLVVFCFDKDTFTPDDEIGRKTLDISELKSQEPTEFNIALDGCPVKQEEPPCL